MEELSSLASKNHEKLINHVVDKAINDAKINLSDINAIAVTQGPGLIGSLMVEQTMQKVYRLVLVFP